MKENETRFLSGANIGRIMQWLLIAVVLCYYLIFPSVSVLYKLSIVPYMFTVVDPGRDSWDIAKTEPKVPSILHGLTPEEGHIPPQEWETTYNSCQGVHWRYGDGKEYSFKLYHDKDMRKFMKTYYPWFLETYDAYPQHIQRVDAARYFIMRKFGGIYLDLDVGCRRSLDNLRRLEKVTLVVPATTPLGISNDFFMAAPEHPFLVFVTERLTQFAGACSWSSYLSVMFSTGPAFFTLALYDYCRTASRQEQEEIGLLSNDDYTKRVLWHVYGSSWITGDGTVIMWVFDNSRTGVVLLIMCMLCFVLCKKQRAMQAKMKNVDSAWDWAGIMLTASKEEALHLPERVREARWAFKDKYKESRDKLSRIWNQVKSYSDEDEEVTLLARGRRRKKKKESRRKVRYGRGEKEGTERDEARTHAHLVEQV